MLQTVDAIPATRQVRLFRNGANQALRIPKEFELPGNAATLRRDGKLLIIEPIESILPPGSPAAMLAMLQQLQALGRSNDLFPDVDVDLPALDDVLL